MLRPATNAWKLVAVDLDLAGDDRLDVGSPGARAPAAAHDGLDAGDQLLGVAGLGQPVVGAEAQAPHALGDGGGAGADDDAELGQRPAEALEPRPGRADHREIDDDRAEAHRHDRLGGDRGGEHAVLPASAVEALAENGEKPESRSRTAIRS